MVAVHPGRIPGTDGAAITGKKRNRLFSYDRYLELLREGTERP